MSSEHTIAEIKDAKRKLERNLSTELQEFTTEYGCAIENLRLGPMLISNEDDIPVDYTVRVSIRV